MNRPPDDPRPGGAFAFLGKPWLRPAVLTLAFTLGGASYGDERSGGGSATLPKVTTTDRPTARLNPKRGSDAVPLRRTGDTSTRGISPSGSRPSTAKVTRPSTPPPPRPQAGSSANRTIAKKPAASTAITPPPPAQEPAKTAPPPPAVEARRIRVRTETGKTTIARLHGTDKEGRIAVILPDGQLRMVSSLAQTDEPFVVASADEMQRELLEGPYAGFRVIRTKHYIVFYKSSRQFADASAKLLENLYSKLLEVLSKFGIPTHEAEFPLVAVIYATEKDFRASKKVARDVQACYEVFTNHIFMYELSENDAPEVAARRRPQTVAHEGTHQVLSNIGVQPRLSEWPMWLIEGLAEYCSTPIVKKKNGMEVITWKGVGIVNAFHMVTIKDLDNPLARELGGPNAPRIGRPPGTPLVEYIVTKDDLTPTDYALAWALTHYLAMKRPPEFVQFLKEMGQMRPLEKRSPKEHLAEFRKAFGNDLVKLGKSVNNHLSKLNYDSLPYFAVIFEQPLGPEIHRRAMVSQSPSMIQQWIESSINPNGGPARWEAAPHPNSSSARLAIEEWIRSR